MIRKLRVLENLEARADLIVTHVKNTVIVYQWPVYPKLSRSQVKRAVKSDTKINRVYIA